MSNDKTTELMSVIKKQLRQAEKLFEATEGAMSRDVPQIGRSGNAAVMVAGLVENYYTCLETAFHKISQHFENHLEPSRWHADLLDKMTLHIEGIRIPAVSEEAFGPLLELQRFRHFKRYYFDLEYDWDRLDFILKKMHQAHPIVKNDLERFLGFLKEVMYH